jgi:hypothetical protein
MLTSATLRDTTSVAIALDTLKWLHSATHDIQGRQAGFVCWCRLCD